MKPAGTLRWWFLGLDLEHLAADEFVETIESQVPAEPHPSLVEWIDNQDTGFFLTYDTIHPSTPDDWFDCQEDV